MLDRKSMGFGLVFGLYGPLMAIVIWAHFSAWVSIVPASSPSAWIFWPVLDRAIFILNLEIVYWTLAILPGILYAAAFFRKNAMVSQTLEFLLLGLSIGLTYSITYHIGRFFLENMNYLSSGLWWRTVGTDMLQSATNMVIGESIHIAIWVIVGAFVCYAATYLGLVRWDKPALKNTFIIILGLITLVAVIPLGIALLTL